LEAKRTGTIKTIRPDLDELLQTSLLLRPQLYDELLRMAGEHEVK